MKRGDFVTVLEAFEGKMVKAVVDWDEEYIYVCRKEEFAEAIKEGREPVCVGFRREYIVGTVTAGLG